MRSILAVLSTHILLFHLTLLTFATNVQLNLPTSFNSAQLDSSALPLVNITLFDYEPCFERRSDRLTANYHDCKTAIEKIPRSSGRRRYIFGRSAHSTYKLPRSFHSGTCIITLDMIHDEQTDILTLTQIRETALALALKCTRGPVFDLGGVQAVEPRNLLYITILGVVPLGTSWVIRCSAITV